MTDYTKLVQALRCVEHEKLACPDCTERDCYANSGRGLWCRVPLLLEDAAAAIEALQAEVQKRGEVVDGDARRVTARCSMCGHLRLGNGAEWANKHVHFCEVCGSRMGDEKA